MTPAVSGGGADRLRPELRSIVATTFAYRLAVFATDGTDNQILGP
jgi:hypothetical protein